MGLSWSPAHPPPPGLSPTPRARAAEAGAKLTVCRCIAERLCARDALRHAGCMQLPPRTSLWLMAPAATSFRTVSSAAARCQAVSGGDRGPIKNRERGPGSDQATGNEYRRPIKRPGTTTGGRSSDRERIPEADQATGNVDQEPIKKGPGTQGTLKKTGLHVEAWREPERVL